MLRYYCRVTFAIRVTPCRQLSYAYDACRAQRAAHEHAARRYATAREYLRHGVMLPASYAAAYATPRRAMSMFTAVASALALPPPLRAFQLFYGVHLRAPY